MDKSAKQKEEKSYEELLTMDPLKMTDEEYLKLVKQEMAENAKLTDEELMAKYKIW